MRADAAAIVDLKRLIDKLLGLGVEPLDRVAGRFSRSGNDVGTHHQHTVIESHLPAKSLAGVSGGRPQLGYLMAGCCVEEVDAARVLGAGGRRLSTAPHRDDAVVDGDGLPKAEKCGRRVALERVQQVPQRGVGRWREQPETNQSGGQQRGSSAHRCLSALGGLAADRLWRWPRSIGAAKTCKKICTKICKKIAPFCLGESLVCRRAYPLLATFPHRAERRGGMLISSLRQTRNRR